jgi:hypothetical protein
MPTRSHPQTRLGYALLRDALRERDQTSVAAALRALEWARGYERVRPRLERAPHVAASSGSA